MVLKTIIFDIDNTLLDFMSFKRGSALAAAKAMVKSGVPAKERELYDAIFQVYKEKGIEYQRTFSDVLEKYEINAHTRERARQAGIIAYTKAKYSCLKPRPKVISTLSSLRKKYKLAVVSDAPRDKAWQRLILSGLDGFFYPVVTFTDTRLEKPNREPFEKALGILHVSAKETLFVGDNPYRDIIGAKKAGLITCLAKYGCEGLMPEEDVADYSIDKFDEILRILKEIEE